MVKIVENHDSSKNKMVENDSTKSTTSRMVEKTKTLNFFSHMRTLSRTELFAGIGPTYLKIGPAVAISVVTRDIVLGRINPF